VKLRGRPEAPPKRRGRTLSSRARGAAPPAVHGPLQRLLGNPSSTGDTRGPNDNSWYRFLEGRYFGFVRELKDVPYPIPLRWTSSRGPVRRNIELKRRKQFLRVVIQNSACGLEDRDVVRAAARINGVREAATTRETQASSFV